MLEEEFTKCRSKLDHGIVGGKIPQPENLRGDGRHHALKTTKGKPAQQRCNPKELRALESVQQSAQKCEEA